APRRRRASSARAAPAQARQGGGRAGAGFGVRDQGEGGEEARQAEPPLTDVLLSATLMRRAPLAFLLPLACGFHQGEPPPARHYTHRAIAGISMGGVGAALTGGDHPERFDAVATLGGPLDAAYMLRYMQRYALGGFCPLAALEAKVAAGLDLNDPAVTADC